MALKDTVNHFQELLEEINTDFSKALKGNKAASQRVRTATIKFERVAKDYRKASVRAERGGSLKKSRSRSKAK